MSHHYLRRSHPVVSNVGWVLSELLDLELKLVDVVAQVIENVATPRNRDNSIDPLHKFRCNFTLVLELLIREVVAGLLDHGLYFEQHFPRQVFGVKVVELLDTLVGLSVAQKMEDLLPEFLLAAIVLEKDNDDGHDFHNNFWWSLGVNFYELEIFFLKCLHLLKSKLLIGFDLLLLELSELFELDKAESILL